MNFKTGDTIEIGGYHLAARLEHAINSDQILVVHNESSHYLVIRASMEGPMLPDYGVFLKSFHYLGRSPVLAYAEALEFAVDVANPEVRRF